MTSPSRARQVAVALLLSGVLSGCGSTFQTAAAVVNGHRISDTEVSRQLELALADPQTSSQLGTGAEREKNVKEATRITLSILIQNQLVQDYAKRQGISIPASDLDQALADTVKQAGGQAAFEARLKQLGLDIGQVRENVGRTLLIQKVALQITSEQVSEAELRAAYDQRITEFTEVHISHILVTSPTAAELVRAQVTPANFAKVAQEQSQDASSSAQGGDLGTRKAVEFAPPLANAVLRAPLEEVAGPVQTDSGYEIFIVHTRTVIPFAEVKASLLSERQNDVFSKWLAEQVRSATIRVNPRYGRLDVATGRVVAITSTDTNAPPPVQLTP